MAAAAEPHATDEGVPVPAEETPFSRFDEWSRRYLAASPDQRDGLRAEGVVLAKARRVALKELIPADPREALNRAVPVVVRQDLPSEVVAWLEERVNNRGFYGVLGVLGGGAPIRRHAVLNEKNYNAFVFGRREGQATTELAYLNGIAVDRDLALDERPLRVLDAGERPSPAKPRVKKCPISGIVTELKAVDGEAPAISEETPAVEAGGTIHFLCSGGHIAAVEEGLVNEEGRIAREGSTGGATEPTGNVPTSSNTGVRTHLYMRVTFPDQMQDPQSEASCYDMMRQVDDFMRENSYGKCYFLTTVTPLLVLPHTEAWYKQEGADIELLSHARAVAKAAGYDPSQYDFDTVRYSGGPGSFGGQAYVGAKGCWLKSSSVGVAAHEYGHNLGLWHANYWSTSPASVIGPGSNNEYGNSFDTMGAANAGNYHFGAYNKSVINWMTPELVATVRQSGTYRIFQHDQAIADPARRYGLKIAKDNERNYWAELRQKFTSNAWMMSGLQLTWDAWGSGGDSSPNGSNRGPQLLDVTPGSPDGKNDSSLVIGRTFSDTEAGVHITPIGKGGTTPESMDVVVNLGSFPGNLAPTLSVTPSATAVNTGTTVSFTATAADPDGDVLAYAWDFGDKAFSTTNLPTVTKSWNTAGQYVVRCTASDMKGKVTTRHLVVNVGSVSTFNISGSVAGPTGQPLEGVLVGNGQTGSAFRGAYTDSNGAYIISNLAAGQYTISAQQFGYNFTAGFSNPVTVGPNASARNFSSSAVPTLTISPVDASARENSADTGTFRIARTGSTASAKLIRVVNPSGTAARGSDYTLTPDPTFDSTQGAYQLTIPAGAAFLDVRVNALNDSTQEGPETVVLQLVPISGMIITGESEAIVTIDDDDTAAPRVRITANDDFATEGADGAQFTVSRTGATTNALSIGLTASGTASNGSDYTPIGSVVIPAGASSATVNLTPVDDSLVEGNEQATLTIASNAAYVRDSTAQAATATINDNDINFLTIVATDSTASEAGDTAIFTITRTGDLTNALTVDYVIGGTALHGTDYLRLPGVATIPAGHASTTITVVPNDDGIGEALQTIVLQLRSKITYQVGVPFSASANLTDNDSPSISVAATDGIGVEPVSGSPTDTARFRIYRAGGSGAFTARYTVSGSATAGVDYTALSGSVAFASADTSKDITVSPLPDALQEGTERVTLTLSPDAAYTVEPEDTSTLLIVDEDGVSVSVSTEDTAITEASGSMRFWISRSGGTSGALNVNYAMTGTATAGVDYSGATGVIVIPAGASGVYLTLTPLEDAAAEGTESVTIEITPTAGSYVAGVGSATYLMGDNDTSGLPQVRFSPNTGNGSEGSASVSIPVTLSAPSAIPVTVNYAITGGTATAGGVDYTFANGVLNFAPGVTAQTITATVLDDNRPETNETIVIALSGPTAATLGASSFTYTINDNDPPPTPTVGFVATASNVQESVISPQTLLVALSAASTTPVTVGYSVTGGTATSGVDYSLQAGTLTFAAGEVSKFLPLSIVQDGVAEANETVVVTLSNPAGATLRPTSQHTLTIDGTASTITVTVTDPTAGEPGAGGSFTFTRAGSTAGAVSVPILISGSAANGSDYQGLPATVNFTAGQSSVVVAVVPLDDAVIEGNETVILTVKSSEAYTVGTPGSATLNLTDDDRNAAPTFAKGSDVSVNEDSAAQSLPSWVTNISAGPGEGNQLVTFAVANNNPGLFAVAPAISPAGTLTFTPAANAFGSATVTVEAQDNGGTANGGSDTSPQQSFTISVVSVNDAPTLQVIGDLVILESADLQTLALSGISTGAQNEADPLHVTASSDNPTLIPHPEVSYASPSESGSLSFKPAVNRSGSATITVTVSDGQGTNGSVIRTFTVQVKPVNNAPTFTAGSPQTVDEDAGAQSVAWASEISVGPEDEVSQTREFIVTTDKPELFATPPAIAADGTLTYRAAPDAFGVATASVKLRDDGGTIDGGTNESATQAFTITIQPVNDAPSFAKGANQEIRQNGGAQTFPGWATALTSGPANEDDQQLEFLVSTDKPELFTSSPFITPDGSLTFTTSPEANGLATVSVRLRDSGGTANGGVDLSDEQTFLISSLPINDAPSFVAGANQSTAQDAGAQVITGWATGISAGPADESDQTVEFTVTADNTAIFLVLPSISPQGDLTYTPAPSASGKAIVTVKLRDSGGTDDGGTDTSAEQTFTIAITSFLEELGTYNGLVRVADEASVTNDRFGTLKVSIEAKGAFSGQVKIAGRKHPFKGTFDNAGRARFGRGLLPRLSIARAGLPELLLSLQLDVSEGSDKITGHIEEGTAIVSVLEADRALYTAKRNPVAPFRNVPSELLGKYNVIFAAKTPEEQGIAASAFPQGDGIAVLSVTKKGTAKLTGWLADGTRVSCSAPLSKLNAWPFHVSLNGGKGSITGPATFRHQAGIGDIDGLNVAWIKPAIARAKRYPAGWPSGIHADLIGARYRSEPGVSAIGVLGAEDTDGNAELVMAGGNITDPGMQVLLNVSAASKVKPVGTASGVSLKIKRATGAVSGTFRHPVTQKKVQFKGIALPEQNLAAGYFLSETESGRVELIPAQSPPVQTGGAE